MLKLDIDELNEIRDEAKHDLNDVGSDCSRCGKHYGSFVLCDEHEREHDEIEREIDELDAQIKALEYEVTA